MPQYQRMQGIKSSLGGGFIQGLLYLGTYLKRPIFLKCENISPPGTYSSIMYRFELSCNDMYCLVSCLWDNIAIGFRPTQLSMYFLNVSHKFVLLYRQWVRSRKYNGHGLYMIRDKIRMQWTLIPGILS